MPAAIDAQVKKQVINQWLSGDSRDRIAADNGIGAGTVSNIIGEWKKGVEDSDYDSLRELAVYSKKEGFGLSHVSSLIRLSNYIQKLGANQDQIESFIANCINGANSLQPEKIIDLTNQLFDISKSESIPPAELPAYVKQKIEEKQTYEEQIQQAGAILEGKNLDIQTINEYKQLEEELKKHGLSIEDPHILVSVLKTIRHIGYNPQKIVSEFSRIKSIRQTEKRLRLIAKYSNRGWLDVKKCYQCPSKLFVWELGPELLALHTAVLKRLKCIIYRGKRGIPCD